MTINQVRFMIRCRYFATLLLVFQGYKNSIPESFYRHFNTTIHRHPPINMDLDSQGSAQPSGSVYLTRWNPTQHHAHPSTLVRGGAPILRQGNDVPP